MKEIKNIMVAIDFHDSVGEILEYAESFAMNFNSKIWVVYVEEADPDFAEFKQGPQYLRDFKAEEFRDEHRTLQALCTTFLGEKVDYEALFIQGPTVETVIEEAQKLKIDLLISGTHKHGFFSNLFSESVSLELFKKINIPFLTVPIEED